jgi:RNA:NAD 2'-phosphotransferase (TPT1/KptA family)
MRSYYHLGPPQPWPAPTAAALHGPAPRRRAESEWLTKISKALSALLRHDAEPGLNIGPDGFCDVTELLETLTMRRLGADREVIKQVVSSQEKMRFELREFASSSSGGASWEGIRAFQGHSSKVRVDPDAM